MKSSIKDRHVVLPYLKRAKLYCIRETVKLVRALQQQGSSPASNEQAQSEASSGISDEEHGGEDIGDDNKNNEGADHSHSQARAHASMTVEECQTHLTALKKLKPDQLWAYWIEFVCNAQRSAPESTSTSTPGEPVARNKDEVGRMVTRRAKQLARKAGLAVSPAAPSTPNAKYEQPQCQNQNQKKLATHQPPTAATAKPATATDTGSNRDQREDNNAPTDAAPSASKPKSQTQTQKTKQSKKGREPASFFTDSLAAPLDDEEGDNKQKLRNKRDQERRKKQPGESLPVEELDGRRRKRAERAERFRTGLAVKKRRDDMEDDGSFRHDRYNNYSSYNDNNDYTKKRPRPGRDTYMSPPDGKRPKYGERPSCGDRGDRNSGGAGRQYDREPHSGSGATTITTPKTPANLHPSWAAKRMQKQKLQIPSVSDSASVGSHMVFGGDDE